MKETNKSEILKQRALEIARQTFSEEPEDVFEVLRFRVSDEIYAIETKYIEEVIWIKNITEIPFTPSFIKGVVNVRGHIYSVVDLADLFDLEKTESEHYKIIIIKNENMEFGILTAILEGVEKIEKKDINPVPLGVSKENYEYILGITSNNTIILNTENILEDENMKVHQEI